MISVLSIDNVTFGYGTASLTLESLSQNFVSGDLVALTGASGRGKSTLLYILGLMLRPRQGSVHLNGERVDRLSDSERAQLRATEFGFVFQDAALDATRTVLENVLEASVYAGRPRKEAKLRATRLLDKFGVLERANGRPGQVSGGQAQRIALARALMNYPSVILADEPTGNLDVDSARVVLDAFREMAEAGSVVIIATHDPIIASRCDRIWQI